MKVPFETLAIQGARVSDFKPFINLSLPCITLIGHHAKNMDDWRLVTLPLKLDSYVKARFRHISYDIMVTTEWFLDHIHEFDDSGVLLYQSSKPLPY